MLSQISPIMSLLDLISQERQREIRRWRLRAVIFGRSARISIVFDAKTLGDSHFFRQALAASRGILSIGVNWFFC